MGDETISKVASISYNYHSTTGIGQTANGIQILADSFENYIESATFLEGIDHECFLHCINDGITSMEEPNSSWMTVKKKNKGGTTLEARGTSNIDSGVVLYRIPHMLPDGFGAETLDAYFKRIKTPFIAKYTVPGMSLESTYVPDVWRDVMKRMIQFTFYLHKHHQSFANRLEKRNFIVVEGKLKFCNLRLRKLSTQSSIDDFGFVKEMIEELSKDFTAKMLEQTHDLTKTLKSKQQPKPEPDPVAPHDLKNLFCAMKSYSSSSENLLLNHLAILSSRDRIRQIVNFKAKRARLEYSLVWNATNEMVVRWEDWTVGFKEKCQQSGPAFKCFMHGSDNNNTPHYVGKHFRGKESLLFFCRNLAVHLPDILIKDYPDFTDIDIDLTIMGFFGEELISFHEHASKYKILIGFL